jgi:glutamate racemase
LVLGCTHYPFLKPAIQHVFGEKLKLIDSGFAVARQTSRILIKNELLFEQNLKDEVRITCFVSGHNANSLSPILSHLMPHDISWKLLNLQDK